MSLFDVLKYPISIPPTEVELRALPEDLIINFFIKTDWCIASSNAAQKALIKENLSGIIYEYTRGSYPNDIPVLRKMIEDYDESV